MPPVLTLFRYVIFAAVAVTVITGFAAMAVQRRTLNPFGPLARGVRRITDPFIKPIERRVLRAGGNPQTVPWWMVAMAVLIGIALISAADWSVGQAGLLAAASAAGPGGLIRLLAYWAFALLKLALIVRVIGSWFGVGAYTKWMRPFYFMTEWFLAPMRRIIPNVGPLDITPLLAWVLLSLIESRVI